MRVKYQISRLYVCEISYIFCWKLVIEIATKRLLLFCLCFNDARNSCFYTLVVLCSSSSGCKSHFVNITLCYLTFYFFLYFLFIFFSISKATHKNCNCSLSFIVLKAYFRSHAGIKAKIMSNALFGLCVLKFSGRCLRISTFQIPGHESLLFFFKL